MGPWPSVKACEIKALYVLLFSANDRDNGLVWKHDASIHYDQTASLSALNG